MKKSLLMAGGALLALVVALGLVSLLSAPRQVDKPGRIEQLQRMPPNTKEESRRYLHIDGKDRKVEIVFQDGCVGVREKDENGNITKVEEKKKDGTRIVYALDEKNRIKSITAIRKTGKLFSIDTVLSETSYRREWFAEDGKTRRATLEVSETREVFTVYDATGAKRYEDIEEEDTSDENGYGGYGPYGYRPPRQSVQHYAVYNGAATPRFKQKVSPNYGYNPYQPQQPQVTIESVDEYEQGSTTVARRITPGSSEWINGSYQKLTKVEVFSNGSVRFVRYLDEKNRIIRTVDKSSFTEETTDIDPANAAVEQIDPVLLQSPETDADRKLAEQIVAGNTDLHLDRLLVP